MNLASDFLFAEPSAWEGIGRLLDFGNTLNEYNTSDEPDDIALRRDWMLVGSDLRDAMNHCLHEIELKNVINT